MKRLIVLLSSLVLAACAVTPPVPATHLLRDELYPGPLAVSSKEEIFASSPEMKQYVETELSHQLRTRGLQRGLLEALYTKRQLQLEYDSERTRNAREAFEARAGNCLSLVIMTSALAKQLGLQVSYHNVYNDETWTRHHDTYFTSGHVNITLGPRQLDIRGRSMQANWTIDFLAPDDLRGQQSHEIDEKTVAAMYMNNRAAEALSAGDLPAAYRWVRASILEQPAFLSAYNTLGVIYLRSGHAEAAERTLAHVLQVDPNKTVAVANMVRVLAVQGRQSESDAMARKLARLDPEPPFHFFDLGRTAMRERNYAAASAFFKKEVARAPFHHEFHFWLAMAEAELGHVEVARKELALALSTSTTQRNQALYAAKLDKLKSVSSLH